MAKLPPRFRRGGSTPSITLTGCNGIVRSITAQAEAQLAQQQQDPHPAPPSSVSTLDMTFDWLGLDMAPAVTATTTASADTVIAPRQHESSSLLTPTSASPPLLGGNYPFTRGYLSNGIIGEPLSDIDMVDAFLVDAHADWYVLCFPMALVHPTN